MWKRRNKSSLCGFLMTLIYRDMMGSKLEGDEESNSTCGDPFQTGTQDFQKILGDTFDISATDWETIKKTKVDMLML